VPEEVDAFWEERDRAEQQREREGMVDDELDWVVGDEGFGGGFGEAE
jgi:hypothetical protein